MEVKVTQSCLTLGDPMDYTVHGILQARILEWVAFPFSRGSSQPRSPTLQADSLPSKPPGNPQNAAMEMLKSMFWCTSPGQQPKGAFPSFRLFLLPLNLCAKKCWAAWLANCIVFNSLIFQAKEPILQWDTRPAFMHYSSGWQYEWLNNHIEFLLEIPGGLEIIT